MAIKHSPGCGCCGGCLGIVQVRDRPFPIYSGGVWVFPDVEWRTGSGISYVSGYEPPTGNENTIAAGDEVRLVVSVPCSNWAVSVEIIGDDHTAITESNRGHRIKVGKYLQGWLRVPTATIDDVYGNSDTTEISATTLNSGCITGYSEILGNQNLFSSLSNSYSHLTYLFSETDNFGRGWAQANVEFGYEDYTQSYTNSETGSTYDIPYAGNPANIIGFPIENNDAGQQLVEITIQAGVSDIEVGEIKVWHGTFHHFNESNGFVAETDHDGEFTNLIHDQPSTYFSLGTYDDNDSRVYQNFFCPGGSACTDGLTVSFTANASALNGTHAWRTIYDAKYPYHSKLARSSQEYFTKTDATASQLTALSTAKTLFNSYSSYTHASVLDDLNLYRYYEPSPNISISMSYTSSCTVTVNNDIGWDSTTSHSYPRPLHLGGLEVDSFYWPQKSPDCTNGWTWNLSDFEAGLEIYLDDTASYNSGTDDITLDGWDSGAAELNYDSYNLPLMLPVLTKMDFDDKDFYKALQYWTNKDIETSYSTTEDLSEGSKWTIETTWTYKKVRAFRGWDNIDGHSVSSSWIDDYVTDPSVPYANPSLEPFLQNPDEIAREASRGQVVLKSNSIQVSSASIDGTDYTGLTDCTQETSQTSSLSATLQAFEQEYIYDNQGTGATESIQWLLGRNLLKITDGTDTLHLGIKDELADFPSISVIDSAGTEVVFDATDFYAKVSEANHETMKAFSVTLQNGSDNITIGVKL